MPQKPRVHADEVSEDDWVSGLPLPLAQLYLRAQHAKNALELHQNAYFLWESSLRLLSAAAIVSAVSGSSGEGGLVEEGDFSSAETLIPERHPLEAKLEVLRQEPGLEQWWELFKGLPQESMSPGFGELQRSLLDEVQLDMPHCSRLLQLLSQVLEEPESRPSKLSSQEQLPVQLGALFEALLEYRKSHVKSSLSERFARWMGKMLLQACAELLEAIDFLAGHQLIYVERVRQESEGLWNIERCLLEGEQPQSLEPLQLQLDDPTTRPLSGRLYLYADEVYDAEQTMGAADYLESWLLLQPLLWFELRTKSCFSFQGLTGPAEGRYLNYTTGVTRTREIKVDGRQALLSRVFQCPIEKPKAAKEAPAPSPPPRPKEATAQPRRIGEFEILSLIGEGGMGTVYRALQPTLGRMVALKTLQRVGSPQAEHRFHREIQALGRIEHPNLVKIYTSGSHDSQWYYAMELIEGADLGQISKRLVQRGTFEIDDATWHEALEEAQHQALAQEQLLAPKPPERSQGPTTTITGATEWEELSHENHLIRIVTLLKQVAEATHALHEAGVLHRDIKPANIMVAKDGEEAVLMDLGLARISDDAVETHLTVSHQFMGTPLYASPEQCLGMGHVDRRSDVYSLGATLWEMLTFEPIFQLEGKRLPEIFEAIRKEEPARPSKINPHVPQDLEAIVLKCLEKDRDRRYATAGLLADDLGRWLEGEAVLAQPQTLGYLMRKYIHRNRAQILSVCALFLVLVAGIISSFVSINEARKEAIQAQQEERKARRSTEQARHRLQRAFLDLRQAHRRLDLQRRAAEDAALREAQAHNVAKERRKRLLQVQKQILEERLRLIHSQKRLQRDPANALLSFFLRVLQDRANPLGQRHLAARGIATLTRRSEGKLLQLFTTPLLHGLYESLLGALLEAPRSPPAGWEPFRKEVAQALLYGRHELPPSIEEWTPHRMATTQAKAWPRGCPRARFHRRSGRWVPPTHLQLQCALARQGAAANLRIALVLMHHAPAYIPKLWPRWRRAVATSGQPSLRRVALSVVGAAPSLQLPGLVEALGRGLGSPKPAQRRAAVLSLGRLCQRFPKHFSVLWSALTPAASDRSPQVRLAWVQQLRALAKKPAHHSALLPWLMQAIQDRKSTWVSWKIRDQGRKALVSIASLSKGLQIPILSSLEEGLKHSSWHVRRYSLDAMAPLLGVVKPELLASAFGLVQQVGRDPRRWVRSAAYRCKSALASRMARQRWPHQKPLLFELLRGLHDRDPWVQRAALSGLERLMRASSQVPPEVLEALLGALSHRSAYVRDAALEALETAGQLLPKRELSSHFLKALKDRSWRVRQTALKLLGSLARPTGDLTQRLLPPLLRAALSSRRQLRQKARMGLSRCVEKDPRCLAGILGTLLAAARHASASRVDAAWAALLSLPWRGEGLSPSLRKALLQRLATQARQPSPVQRSRALRALVLLDSTKAGLEVLLAATGDPHWKVRRVALQLLAQAVASDPGRSQLLARRPSAQGEAWLHTLLYASVRDGASRGPGLKTVARFASRDLQASVSLLLSLPHKALRRDLAAHLSKPSHAAALSGLLHPAQMRLASRWLRRRVGLPFAAHGWMLPSAQVRAKAAQLLGRTCHPDALEPLRKALADPSPQVQARAARAYAFLAPLYRRPLTPLKALSRSPHPLVRDAAKAPPHRPSRACLPMLKAMVQALLEASSP